MMIRAIVVLTALAASVPVIAQDPPVEQSTIPASVPLWPTGAPGVGARSTEAEIGRDYWVRNIHRPSVIAYPANRDHNSGAAVVIFPGGGHKLLVWTNEGTKAAVALNRMGISAFVVKYRLANEPGSPYSVEGDAADDARRAVRWVRANAARYGIDPKRVGVMGFSAGGELVSLIADNCWNGGVVLGTARPVTREALVGARGRQSVNGAAAGEGAAEDPFATLAWLANLLAERGRGLAAGMVVITGSLVPTFSIEPGDHLVFAVDGLGEAVLDVA